MAGQAPTAVIQAALSRFNEVAASASALEAPVAAGFVEAPEGFIGSKAGYFFGTGDSGIGYYRDFAQAAPQLTEEIKKQVTVDPEQLLREAEERVEDLEEIQLLDLKGLRRMVNLFDRRFKDNMELRMKYSEEPDKFMDSEVELDDVVKRMMIIAGSPELYPDLARTQAFTDLLGLLMHDNTDVAGDVLELFRELTDADVVQDSEDEAQALVEAMLEGNALELLVQRLASLDETQDAEAAAVYAALSIFENIIELKPEVSEQAVQKTKLLRWIMDKVKQRAAPVDSNKQYTSELLAILMQHSESNQVALGAQGGIDIVLQAIAYYKNRDPQTSDEEEYLENLFDALCTCLMQPRTRKLFLDAEGVELMAIILKQKRLSRVGALKALDFATTRFAPACERFVNMGGLKTLFAVFMGRSRLKGHRKSDASTERGEEERVVSIICNLLSNLGRGSRRDRLAAKFVEAEFEKIDRLMEIYTEYEGRVAAEEKRLSTSVENYTEDDISLARLDAGLYTLQQVALIIGNLWMVGDMSMRHRVLTLLHQQSHSLAHLRATLREHHDSLGDEGKMAEDEKQRVKVQRLLVAMGASPHDFIEAPLPPEPPAAPQDDEPPTDVAQEPPAAQPPLPAADDDMDTDDDAAVDRGDADEANEAKVPAVKPSRDSEANGRTSERDGPTKDRSNSRRQKHQVDRGRSRSPQEVKTSKKRHEDESSRRERKRDDGDRRHHKDDRQHKHKDYKGEKQSKRHKR